MQPLGFGDEKETKAPKVFVWRTRYAKTSQLLGRGGSIGDLIKALGRDDPEKKAEHGGGSRYERRKLYFELP